MTLPAPYYRDDDNGIVLYCGDCLDLLKEFEPWSVDAVVTDPPYGIGGYVSSPSKWRRRAGHVAETWDDGIVDLCDVLYVSDRVVIWGGNNYCLPPSRNFLCWYKPDAPPSMAQCEFAWCSWDGNAKHITQTISATNRERNGHPTQKPLRVMVESLEHVGGDLVLDPYVGSGTTLVACLRTGRRGIGIEISPEYCEIAAERLRREKERTVLFDRTAAKHQRTIELAGV